MILISIKICGLISFDWAYIFLIFTSIAVYMIVLGTILGLITCCAVLGYLYHRVEPWITKALLWQSSYYFLFGIIYLDIVNKITLIFDIEQSRSNGKNM